MYRFLNVPWGTIRMRNWGVPYNKAETRLLFVNGAISGINQWSFLADELLKKNDISLVGFDQPGMGKSTIPDLYINMPNLHGFSIYCLLKELDWHSAHICGHSAGAQNASIFSLLFPEMVQSLTNIDGWFDFKHTHESTAQMTREYIEQNMKRYKAGKPYTSIVRPYQDFVKDFKKRCISENDPATDWDSVADIYLKDLIEKQNDGQYELKFNSVAQNTANWMFGEDDYRRLARRVEFPVNYIRGRDWENVFTLMPPPFDPDIQYLNDSYKLVKKYALRNGVPFSDVKMDGCHYLHLTHQNAISKIILDTIAQTE